MSILLIDKPAGITSFDVIRRLRRRLGMRKMGHAGTLDPFATGLLIVATEADTKKLPHFMGMPKTYEAVFEFGKISSTYDADGEIKEQSLRNVERAELAEVLTEFIGEIDQSPPRFSAIKIRGRRAYDLARAGREFVLPKRKVHVFSIKIIKWGWPLVELEISCGKGTYIRSLAHDMGARLGCGAYVKALRRTKIGDFSVGDAVGV